MFINTSLFSALFEYKRAFNDEQLIEALILYTERKDSIIGEITFGKELIFNLFSI